MADAEETTITTGMTLTLDHLRLPLTDFAVEVDVTLSGRVTAIFGPSGAGKTSLLESVAGLRTPEAGRIVAGDTVLWDRAAGINVPCSERRLGYVPQDLALFPHLSVKQNLLYGFSPRPDDSRITFEHVVELLDIVGLLERAIANLSGGEKQRVAFARALLTSPRLLLLDEPLSSLDGELKGRILDYLRRIRDEFKIPMLYVTHDRSEVLALADELVVMQAGRVQQCGPVLEVFNRPASRDVAKIVGMETMQPGRVVSVEEGLATVDLDGVRLTAVAPEKVMGNVLVCIRGEEVILQRESGAGSSVRNRLAARVVALRPEGALVRVELDAGFPLFALVTRPACAELGLQPGESVTALIKAPAIHLVARG